MEENASQKSPQRLIQAQFEPASTGSLRPTFCTTLEEMCTADNLGVRA